jgi:hypothetical protein
MHCFLLDLGLDDGKRFDLFGKSVTMNNGGTITLIGSYRNDKGKGTVYIYLKRMKHNGHKNKN